MVRRRNMRDSKAKFNAVMALLAAQKSVEDICLEYGVPRRSLYRWRLQLMEEGPLIFDREPEEAKAAEARVAELEQMVGRLTMEMEVLKKASGLLNARSKKDER